MITPFNEKIPLYAGLGSKQKKKHLATAKQLI